MGHGREKEVGEKCPKKPDPLIPPQPTKPTQDPLQPPLPGASHLAWVTLTAQQLRSAGAAAWSEKKTLPSIDWEGLRQMLRGGERGGGSSLAILMYSGW